MGYAHCRYAFSSGALLIFGVGKQFNQIRHAAAADTADDLFFVLEVVISRGF